MASEVSQLLHTALIHYIKVFTWRFLICLSASVFSELYSKMTPKLSLPATKIDDVDNNVIKVLCAQTLF